MESRDHLSNIQLEIIGTSNPINIQMSNFNNILGLELEQFHYKPISTAPTNFIGIKCSGSRGRYNEHGLQNEILKTIPNVGGTYSYTDSNGDTDAVRYVNNGTNLIITFVDRNSNSLNPTLIQFDNNYLLNISLLVQ